MMDTSTPPAIGRSGRRQVGSGSAATSLNAASIIAYKRRLIDYLERFMGDLVRRSDAIAQQIQFLSSRVDPIFFQIAGREASDAAPGSEQDLLDEKTRRWQLWREQWKGLRSWFLSKGAEPSQAEQLRARARAAIPQLLAAIAAMNERRSGRSDRSADFRTLAQWFAACKTESQAHRLGRAAFALQPARHFSLNPHAEESLPASTPWADAPPLEINPRLREYGEVAPRGPLARVRDRSAERALMAAQRISLTTRVNFCVISPPLTPLLRRPGVAVLASRCRRSSCWQSGKPAGWRTSVP